MLLTASNTATWTSVSASRFGFMLFTSLPQCNRHLKDRPMGTDEQREGNRGAGAHGIRRDAHGHLDQACPDPGTPPAYSTSPCFCCTSCSLLPSSKNTDTGKLVLGQMSLTTFEALDLATAGGPVRIGWALTWPEFALLRGDPRLRALRKKVGLPE